MRAVFLVVGFWFMAGLMCITAVQAAEPPISDQDQAALDQKLERERDAASAPAELQPCVGCILKRPLPLEVRSTAAERVPGAIPTAQRGTTGIPPTETVAQPLAPSTPVTQKIPGLAPSVAR